MTDLSPPSKNELRAMSMAQLLKVFRQYHKTACASLENGSPGGREALNAYFKVDAEIKRRERND